MPDDLETQLAHIFQAGLDAEPELRASLAGALNFSRIEEDSRPTSDDKATKAEADYREADNEEACGVCEFYREPGRCHIVSGSIDPNWVCDWFEGLDDGEGGDSERGRDAASGAEEVPPGS